MAIDIDLVLGYRIWNNPVLDYLIAFGAFALTILVLFIIKIVIAKRLEKISAKSKNRFDDTLYQVVKEIGFILYGLVGLLVATRFIDLSGWPDRLVNFIIFIGLVFYAIRILQKIINYSIRAAMRKSKGEEEVDETAAQLLTRLIGLALWIIAIILIISNMGYDVTTLIAGLGIGGIAIAFALQNVLSDIFASFSIYIDKPFKVGDFIIIGDDLGVVKKIGIKTTRIQALRGEEISISNRELTSTRVHNFKRMQKRRVDFTIGVTYDTSVTKLNKIPKIVEKIMKKVGMQLDRVHFKKYGDFSLIYEIVYYIGTNDYNKFMDAQQEINLLLKKEFEKEKIEFAYPTQTLFVSKA